MAEEGTEPPVRRLEQRVHQRRTGAVRCWVRDRSVSRYASIVDISLDGARVVTAAPPQVGETVELRFRLRKGGREVRTRARVVWRSEGFRGRGGVMGLQFTHVVGADEIAAYMEEG